MDRQQLNLLDLPDEILLMIFKELNTIDVLYFVVNVNQRLNYITHDYLFVRQFDLTGLSTIKDRCNEHSTDEQVLSHLCQNILGRIHYHIHRLTLEPYLMKDIIGAANYPQLYSLSLRNFQDQVLHQYFTDDLFLHRLCKQITHLRIDVKKVQQFKETTMISNTFALILSLCDKLIDLEFDEHISDNMTFSPQLYLLSINFLSTTLTKLKITVTCFHDCLYLLDGRLESLSTLIINVEHIFDLMMDIGNKQELPKLKIFSFTSFSSNEQFDTLIVPLLRRMINLQQLKLYLTFERSCDGYLDGVQMSDLFLTHLKQLQMFTFNIQMTALNCIIDHPLPTNEVIQRSFTGKHYSDVISVVYDGYNDETSTCRIYSMPYDFDYFHDLNNSFSGGSFKKVRFVTMDDEHPFENELFRLLSRDMPFLEQLKIWNEYPQQHQDQSSTILAFPNLKRLDVQYAHDDYVELFLLKTNCFLPCLSFVRIQDQSVRKLQSRFNGDSSHFNINDLFSQLN